jgi:abhydrolase domain-containing protein 5
MLHGYGGSHIHYSRMYKPLMKDYNIISVDLPGMGYCSKNNILINNATEALEYFIAIIIGFI